MSRTRSWLSVFIASLLLAAAAPARAQAIACGMTLYQSITLQSDLVCPQYSNGFIVGADNVTIDLNGYRLVGGPYTGASVFGIQSSWFDGVSVVSGTIEGFGVAIAVTGGKNHFIGKVTASDNPSGSIYLWGTTFSRVQDSEFESIALESGGFTLPAVGNHIEDNRVYNSGRGSASISVGGCLTSENVIRGNHVTGNSRVYAPVLVVGGAAHGNAFEDNLLEGWTELQGSHNNYVRNTVRAASNDPYAMGVIGGAAIPFCPHSASEGSGNNLLHNRIAGGLHGVRVQSLAGLPLVRENVIFDNTISGSASSGIFFAPSAEKNDARGNRYGRMPLRVHDLGRGNLWP